MATRTFVVGDAQRAPVGTGAVLSGLLRGGEVRVVTTEDDRPVIVTSHALDGDVIATVDPRWLRAGPAAARRATLAAHQGAAQEAFAGLWRAGERWTRGAGVALGALSGGGAFAWSPDAAHALIGGGVALVCGTAARAAAGLGLRAVRRRLFLGEAPG